MAKKKRVLVFESCKRCGNRSYNKDGECMYCIWTGDIGPGKLLKEKIKEINDNRKDVKTAQEKIAGDRSC